MNLEEIPVYRKIILSTAESVDELAKEPAEKPVENDEYKADIISNSKPPLATTIEAIFFIYFHQVS